jgi:hypothetical protein
MNLAIYTIVGSAFVIALCSLYLLGLIVELVCAFIDRRTAVVVKRNRVIVFGDTAPLQGKYHCDVEHARSSFVKHP